MFTTYNVAFLATFVAIIWLIKHRNHLALPPGPPTETPLGHARILPSENQEVAFHKWSKLYGDIMHFRIPGRSYIVLSSLKVANELLEKRGGIFSDRPRLILYELMGWLPVTAFLPYGKRFQNHRRLLNEYLHQKKCEEYKPLQTNHARKLLLRLIDKPDDWYEQLERFAASVVINIAYGREIESDDDPLFHIVSTATKSLSACGSPGGAPVDFLPFLQYLPHWFPGTYYAYKAKSFRSVVHEMFEYPYLEVKKQLENGTAGPSYMSHYLRQLNTEDSENQDQIEDLKGSAGAIYAAGVDTTHGTLAFFFYAMVLFPECQKKAQVEIDRVIGRERLPELDDRESLPYVNAILNETLRWHTVVPLGVPHSSLEDDVYNGMFIPKGSIVMANARAMLRDESIYSNPDEFNPSRYLPKPEGKSEPYPTAQFGFGRRICPGRYLADANLWIAISSILAVLTIGKAVAENGLEIVPELELVTGITSHPKPFPCSIKLRHEAAEILTRNSQFL